MSRNNLFITILVVLLALASLQTSAQCSCSATGDPHYMMCDGKTRFDWQGEGMYTMFKTDELEVMCSQYRLKGEQVAHIDWCRIELGNGDCSTVIDTGSEQTKRHGFINGKPVNAATVVKDIQEADKRIVAKMEADQKLTLTITMANKNTVVITKQNDMFVLQAPTTKTCSGMCGTCAGAETSPSKDVAAFAKQFSIEKSIVKMCGQEVATTTTVAPTTTTATAAPIAAASTTAAPTSTSTTSPAVAVTFPAFKAPNETLIVQNPVFESEKVMKSVIKACMAGQNESRFKEDVQFAGFVENCIYDKSLGPGMEGSAKANLDALVCLHGQKSNSSKAASKWPALQVAAVLEKHVSKRPEQIPADQGATFELMHTKTEAKAPLASYLNKRAASFSAAKMASGYSSWASSPSSSSAMVLEDAQVSAVHKMRMKMDFEVPVVVITANKKKAEDAKPAQSGGGNTMDSNQGDPQSSGNNGSSSPNNTSSSAPPKTQIPISTTTTTTTTEAPKTYPPSTQVQVMTVTRVREIPGGPVTPVPPPQATITIGVPVPGTAAPVAAAPIAAAPVMAAPMMAAPVMAAPIAAAPMVAVTPGKAVQMEAKASPEQQAALQAQQAAQRAAVKQNQDREMANLKAQQDGAAAAAAKPVKFQVQTPPQLSVIAPPQGAMMAAAQPAMMQGGAAQPAMMTAAQPAMMTAAQPAMMTAAQPAMMSAAQPVMMAAAQPAMAMMPVAAAAPAANGQAGAANGQAGAANGQAGAANGQAGAANRQTGAAGAVTTTVAPAATGAANATQT